MFSYSLLLCYMGVKSIKAAIISCLDYILPYISSTANQSLVLVCAQSVPGRHNFSRPKFSAFYGEVPGIVKTFFQTFNCETNLATGINM